MNITGLAAFGAATLCASVAVAQTPAASGTAANKSDMQMSQSECTNLWQQANPSNSPGLNKAQSKAYVTDFKATNPDGDATIDQNEWMAACNKGLVKSSSSSGASTGASGSSEGKTSDRTPGDPAPNRTPGATDSGAAGTDAGQTPAGTSDRTPNK
jgi:hypothetical protein